VCTKGASLFKLELGGGASQRFAVSFSVPAGCETQTLSLVVRPTDDVQGASGEIDSVSLVKVD
jgi:hypothetical protein